MNIIEYAHTIATSIQNYLDVSKIEIPTIYFTGSDTELATVFENLNRGGKKLSKYQVFAAQWYKYEVTLSDKPRNEELLTYTIEWYETLETERKIEIKNFDPDKMRDERKINIAELCSAFGRMIIKETPVFWQKASDDTANEIGYSSMAIILGIKNKDLSNIIADENKVLFNDPIFVETMIESALQVYKNLNTYFQHYLHTPGNLGDFKYSLGSNFQILSYFGALWNTRYTIDKQRKTVRSKDGSKKDFQLVMNNLLKWYLYDILENNWSGSGDSKLDSIVIEQSNKYMNEVESETINNALSRWYEDQLQKRSINFEPIAKIIYTINASFDTNRYNGSSYDLEHIIPRKLLNKTPATAMLSGGTLGNLMFLEKATNRSKKEQFMYTYVSNETYEIKQDFLDLNYYPTKQSLIQSKIELESKTTDFSNTQAVIKNRGKEIINSLIDRLSK